MMLWRSLFRSAHVLLFMAPAAVGELVRIAEIDVVANGGFEEGKVEDRPDAWTPRKDVPAGVRLTWDTKDPHSGKRCIGIESTYGQDRPWFWWEQAVRLSAGETCRLTCWMRTRNLERGAVLVLSCRDASGKEIARRHLRSLPAGTAKWTKVTGKFVTPPGTVKGRLQFSTHGRGQVWLDDVRVAVQLRPQMIPPAKAKVYPVALAAATIAVDGLQEEWREAPRADVRAAYAVSQAEAIIMDKEDSKGSDDLSFSFAARHDSARLFLMIAVRDDVRKTVRPYWQGDSIQFALDTTFGRSKKGFGAGDYAIGVVLKGTGAKGVIERKPKTSSLTASHIEVACETSRSGYTVELAIPWRHLLKAPPKHNQRMGFSIIVNDNDGGGRKWAEWTPGIAREKRPAQYGTLLFLSQGNIGLCLDAPAEGTTDLRPLGLHATLASLAKEETKATLALAFNEGGEGQVDSHEVVIRPGITRIPLVYAAGSVEAGAHTASVSVEDITSRASFHVKPLRSTIAEAESRLRSIRHNMQALTERIAKGKARKLDMALPDVTLVTAEHFAKWVTADAARDGHEGLALREARKLGTLVERALEEAGNILARPKAHPTVQPPNVMEATMHDGGWYVGDRPVFLIGFNGFDKEFLSDLSRFGCNFNTSGGGAAGLLLRNGPEPDMDAIRQYSTEHIRKAAALGIRSNIHFGHRMPKWAIEKYPDITDAEGHFMFYDMDHPDARRLTCLMMESVARAIRELPGVTCYDLWNEAAFNRMSKRGLAKFRAAMRKRYETVGRLNASWGTAYTGFGQIKPVTRDPAQPAAYTDWVRWNNARFTAYVAEMREAVRRGDPKALTTVKLSNEAVVVGTQNHAYRRQRTSRHNLGVDRWALAQLLEIQGCDTRPTLLSPDYAFAWRYPGMAYGLQQSMAPEKPIDDSEWHGVQTVYHEDVDQPAEFLNAALWFSYLHGMDMNLTWWWSRKGSEPKTQWFVGSLTTQPQLLDAFGRNSVIVQRFAPEIVAFQDARPRVRILFSKPSAILDLNCLDTMRDAYESLNWLGVPSGFVTEEMLLNGFSDCDLLVIPAARHASPGVRKAVATLARSGVHVIRIGQDCLSLNPHGKPMVRLQTIKGRAMKSGKEVGPLVTAFKAADIRRQALALGPDGISSKPVEFRTVEHKGRLLGYIIGLGKEPAEIRIERDGRPARWRSLLTGERREGSLSVKPFDVDLFVFE